MACSLEASPGYVVPDLGEGVLGEAGGRTDELPAALALGEEVDEVGVEVAEGGFSSFLKLKRTLGPAGRGRQWLGGQSFEQQRVFGQQVLRYFGVGQ